MLSFLKHLPILIYISNKMYFSLKFIEMYPKYFSFNIFIDIVPLQYKATSIILPYFLYYLQIIHIILNIVPMFTCFEMLLFFIKKCTNLFFTNRIEVNQLFLEEIIFMDQNNNYQMSNNQQLQEMLEGIRQAVQGEREDELFYDYLIDESPTNEEKEIIASIRDDELRHNKIFRMIYEDFTGREIPSGGEENFERPESYLEGIKKALFGELRAVEKYRAIRKRLSRGIYRDVLFDIITDELKHASKYNYLFTLNSTMGNLLNNSMNSSIMGINQMRQDTADIASFTPDDWVRYITPLVNRALAENKEGINPEHLYQEFILSGVLVGLGKKPDEAIEQVEEWEKTGTSKLLAISKMNRYFNQ